jgi:hypothetical protein
MSGFTGAGRILGSRSRRAALIAALVTAAGSLWLTLPAQVLRRGETPPGLGDARDYDHLALNLARGRGYAFCWSDPEWRAPYENAPNRRDYAIHLVLEGPCRPTAYRAPGYPVALAVLYRFWGRSFQAARLLGTLALALAGALGAFLAVRAGGLAAAFLFAYLFLGDDQPRRFVGALMSEGTASLAVMLTLAAHYALTRHPTPRTGLLAGSLLGLLMLLRSFFAPLWAVGLVGALLAAVRSHVQRPCWLAYAGAALLVPAPWAVRNCLLLDAPLPLGTQGGHALAGRYVDDEIRGATWNSELVGRLWAARMGLASVRYSLLERKIRMSLAVEREMALMGQQAAREWLTRNWRRLPAAALLSLRAHARGYETFGLAAVLCAFAGLAIPEIRGMVGLGLAVVVTNALTVALTYEAAGRFSVPVRPVAYLAGSIAVAALLARLLRASASLAGRSQLT